MTGVLHRGPGGRTTRSEMDVDVVELDPGRRPTKSWDERHPGRDEGAAHGFPGCRPIRIAREDIVHYEGRIEYWDADTEIAWTAREPTSIYHELPGQRLARLSERIAQARGAQIESYGTGDLLVRDDKGARHRMMQADQILYLHPGRVRSWATRSRSATTTFRRSCSRST